MYTGVFDNYDSGIVSVSVVADGAASFTSLFLSTFVFILVGFAIATRWTFFI